MGLSKQECSERRLEALRRKQQFERLADAIGARRACADAPPAERRPVPCIELAVAAVKPFPRGSPRRRS